MSEILLLSDDKTTVDVDTWQGQLDFINYYMGGASSATLSIWTRFKKNIMSTNDHNLILKQVMATKPQEKMDENSYLPLRDRLRKAETINKILEEAVKQIKLDPRYDHARDVASIALAKINEIREGRGEMNNTDRIINAAEKLKECIWQYLEEDARHNDVEIRNAMNNLLDELED